MYEIFNVHRFVRLYIYFIFKIAIEMSANSQQDDEWLDMHLVSGHFLHNHNFFSKQDPYVVMYYNDAAVFKSTTKRSAGSDASWNERLQVRPLAPSRLLIF